MSNAMPWAVVIPYCLLSMFLYYQKLHAQHFRGASQTFWYILVFTGFIGMVTGIVFLIYYGFKVAWWAPLLLFVLGIGFQMLSTFFEDLIGMFAISMLGFVGWPICAILMFISVPNLDALKREKETVSSFISTIESANLAAKVINQGKAFTFVPSENTQEIMKHYRTALAHAEKVDSDFLNKKFDGWGTHFEKELLAGLRLIVESQNKADSSSLKGQLLLDSWGRWYDNNVLKLKKLK